jgi:tetratricopeptide (TPR) repeat protein
VPDRTREPAHLETNASAWLSAFKPVLLRRSGAVVGLWGAAGIGKTFTAKSALRELSCRSLSVHATVPLSEMARVLPNPKRLPVWAERNLERLERGDHLEMADAANVLAAVLNGLAPVVLHVEDLHEADAERAELWATLAGIVLRSRGVGLLTTSRTEPPRPFRAVRLGPMSRPKSDALIEAEARSKVPTEALEWMYHRAAGNPLFTLEFFRFLARMGHLWSDAKRWHWRTPEGKLVPVTIEALIESVILRIKDAPSQDQPSLASALEAKAILPPGANETLWANVSALEPQELTDVRHRLEEQGLLVNGEFVHPLYREVIAGNLDPGRRRALSRRAFQALEYEDVRAAAAFVGDAKLEPDEALGFLERAAEIARAVDDATQAARFLAQAVDFARGEVKGRLALETAKGFRSVYPAEAVRMAELAANHLTDNTEAIFELAELHVTEQRMDDATRVLERLPASERNGPRWWARLIFVKSWAGNPSEAIELWEVHPEWHASADANLIYRIAWVLPENRNAERVALAEKTLERPDLSALDRAKLLSVIASVAYTEFRPAQSVELYTEVIRLAREAGNLSGEAAMLGNRASALYDLDRYTDSKADLEASMRLHANTGSRLGVAFAQQSLAGVLIHFADYERAEELLLESREVMLRADPSEFLVDCERELCNLYIAWQPPHAKMMAHKHAQAALSVGRGLDLPRAICKGLVNLAAAENFNAHHTRALELANEANALSTANGLNNSISAQIERAVALGCLGRRDEALESFREIERAAQGREAQKTLHLIGLEMDRLTNNLERARERLTWFEAHDLVHGANLVRRYFPMLEITGPQIVINAAIRSEAAARLELLGPARVTLNDQPVSSRGAKRLELLVVLLEARIRGRTEVSQLELCDALYPDVPEPQAAQSLKKMVQLVRGNLGKGAILTTNAGYALGQVASDAEVFLETGDTQLWRGAYLEGAKLSRDDETVQDALYRALRSRIEILLTTDPREAARVSRILLEAEPYDRACLELALRALRASDNHRSLARLYDDAHERFQEIGEVLPERWQDLLEPQAV